RSGFEAVRTHTGLVLANRWRRGRRLDDDADEPFVEVVAKREILAAFQIENAPGSGGMGVCRLHAYAERRLVMYIPLLGGERARCSGGRRVRVAKPPDDPGVDVPGIDVFG